MKHISISLLAREIGLSDLLLTKPDALKMFDLSLQRYGSPQSGDVYLFDMDGVASCTGGFVCEFFLRWLCLIHAEENSLFVLCNVKEGALFTVDSILTHSHKEKRTPGAFLPNAP